MTPTPGLAWVTGAGKGIGRALVLRLVAAGWTVAASARTPEDLLSLAAQCPSGKVRCFPLDVTDQAAAKATVESIELELGPLDLVVLNAGTHVPMAARDFAVEPFRFLVETNLMGTVNCLAPAIASGMRSGSGHIAVVASLAGYRGLPTASAYGATKAGLINMCEALKPELERHGLRLSLINPGFVATPLTERNPFPMPFLIPVEAAADAILHGLHSSAFEISFPWRFAFIMKVLRILPDRLFFALARRMMAS